MKTITILFYFVSSLVFSQISEQQSFLNDRMHKPPIFPGCDFKLGKKNKRICFKEKLNQHISSVFEYPIIAIDSGYTGTVVVYFELNEKGIVENISADGQYSILEKEAIRIISKLPMIKPAKNRKGTPVSVKFSTQIFFKLN